MKKRILTLCLLLLAAAMLASCGKPSIDPNNISMSITPNGPAASADDDTAGEDTAEPEDVPDEAPSAPAEGEAQSAPPVSAIPNQPEVKPSATAGAADIVPDGAWPASFRLDNWNAGAGTLTATLYTMDLYAAADIEALHPGSSIVVAGRTVNISSIVKVGSGYDINGGISMDGVSLIPYDSATYRVSLWDDYPTFTSVGTFTLAVSPNVTLKDSADYNTLPDGVTVSAAGLAGYLASCEYSSFNVEATTVTVKNGQVTEVVRAFMP